MKSKLSRKDYHHRWYEQKMGREVEVRIRNRTPEQEAEFQLKRKERELQRNRENQKKYYECNCKLSECSIIDNSKQKKQILSDKLDILIQSIETVPIKEIELVYTEIRLIEHKLKAI